MPSFIDHLNTQFKPLFEAVNDGYVPTEHVGLTEGFTGFYSNGEDAFALNVPIAGMFRSMSLSPGIELDLQPAGDRFILRTIMGYAAAASAAGNSGVGNLRISNLINNMTVAAYKVYGPRVTRLTFDRPDGDGGYFRELENSAGYEIRLYGELTPAPVRFEMETVNE